MHSTLKNIKIEKNSIFGWKSFIFAFLIFGGLSIFPTILFGGFEIFKLPETQRYVLWYALYWIGITALLSIFIIFLKYIYFDFPMSSFSNAMEKVENGDFSVRLRRPRPIKKKDYVDELFEDFNHMVEQLASIETLKNDFIADVSHEIKTPLAIIQNYITALQQEDLNEEEKNEYMDTIIKSAEKLTTLVSNILKLNKLENQKTKIQAEEWNLGKQLSESILRMERLWEEKNITISAELEERVMCKGDAQIAELIWNNLLSNAQKFTEKKGRVTIRLKTENRWAIVEIQDSGCGMDEITRRHVFDKFYQGDTSHATEGNGLGMAMVKKAVDLLEGKIEVESEEGKGTLFHVRIPR